MIDFNNKLRLLSWVFQAIAALILGMAAFGKFSNSDISLYIFKELKIEDTRIIIAALEGLSSILLLTKFAHYGALLGFGTMMGALIAHATVLGINVQNDSGKMFIMMFIVIISTVSILWIKRRRLPFISQTLSS